MTKNIEKYQLIVRTLEKLEKELFTDVMPVKSVMTADGIKLKKVPYGSRQTVLEDTSDWDKFEADAAWGEPDTHYCFHVAIDIPESFRGRDVLLFLTTGAEDIWNTNNPQMLVYINGKRRCGMDMNHNSVTIYEKADWASEKDRHIDIRIYAYSNLEENENSLNMTIAARNEDAQQLYFDMKVPFEAMQAMLGIPSSKRESVLDTTAGAFEEQNKNAEVTEAAFTEKNPMLSTEHMQDVKVILDELYAACNIPDGHVLKASQYLRDNLYGKNVSPVTVSSVGHTHIDVAWKWQIRQTREKVIRSYSTVMELMGKYPEYRFMASTPQMYEFVKEDEPELFEEIKEKVREGRFEPEGAMWLEADCNLTSGESLVRQLLYGKEYFEKEFGAGSNILWLPDVFGYSAALPQILKKSGVKAFMTTKVAWNDTNRMPDDFFMWKGIDGSKIPTYIITTCDYDKAKTTNEAGGILNYTYNGRQNASQIMGTWEAFREKSLTQKVLTCYGYGDGGGGPTWEMLEMNRRLEMGIPGVPRTEQSSVSEFFDRLLKETDGGKAAPIWDGELYLEYHRGTYTSIGKNKKNNRRSEYLIMEAELLSVYAFLLGKAEYPQEEIKEIWKKIMLNQFHDILPGSSIEAVYKDSDKDYAEIEKKAKELINAAWESIKKENKIPAKKKDLAETAATCNEKRGAANLGGGSITFQKADAGKLVIENRYYKAVFDKNGEIESLYDKEAEKELRAAGALPLNRLIAFEDKPKEYDCWNIDSNFEDVSWDITDVKEMSVKSYDNGGQAAAFCDDNPDIQELVICIKRSFKSSAICQNIHMYADSRRIDFETNADWHEHQTLLKAAFPVSVDSDEITCEIQYGNIKRSLRRDTSWEMAKFECCAHKWIDISEKDGSHGIAVLNDCKYGYDAKENLMRLTLIKSGIYPNPNADQGLHEFTYSLFPHMGDYRDGKVIEEARKLNDESHFYLPLEYHNVHDDKHIMHGEYGVYELMRTLSDEVFDINTDGVYVEAIKLAENKKGIIIRLYEGYGELKTVKATMFEGFNIKPLDVIEVNLMENDADDLTSIKYDRQTGEATFEMKPFEIKTILVKV